MVVLNPRGFDSVLREGFEAAYLMRHYSVAYLQDQYAQRVSRVRACLLRCFPHEWGVLFEDPFQPARRGAGAASPGSSWRYAGRCRVEPGPKEVRARAALAQFTLRAWRANHPASHR